MEKSIILSDACLRTNYHSIRECGKKRVWEVGGGQRMGKQDSGNNL